MEFPKCACFCDRECPDELKEATSSLMFASSRCGEFPELLHIRGVLSSTFGKEFVARAVDLRNNCSVHPKVRIIQSMAEVKNFIIKYSCPTVTAFRVLTDNTEAFNTTT